MLGQALFPFRAIIQKDQAVTAMQEWLDVAELRGYTHMVPSYKKPTQELLNQFKTSTSFIEQCWLWRKIHKLHWQIITRSFDDIRWKHTATDFDEKMAEITDFENKYRRSTLFF